MRRMEDGKSSCRVVMRSSAGDSDCGVPCGILGLSWRRLMDFVEFCVVHIFPIRIFVLISFALSLALHALASSNSAVVPSGLSNGTIRNANESAVP